jgi:hypothetical protein
VLEVKDNDSDFSNTKTAFLLLDELLRDKSGNVEARKFGSSNDFPNSEIREWLNDMSGFLADFDVYHDDILDTTYGPDNGNRKWSGGTVNGKSKVFLLGVEEATNNSYFANDTDRAIANKTWWLRSPGYDSDIAALAFGVGRVGRNGSYVENMYAVRPALKINLSPFSEFASVSVSYGLVVKIDDGNNPIPGAKASLALSSTAQSTASFSNSVGITRFANIKPGEYTVTVSKPGYAAELLSITVPGTPSISLTPDSASLPGKVRFGKHNGEPIEWDVLDIVNGRALLLAGTLFDMNFDNEGSNVWESSTLRAFLNSSAAGVITGFLHEDNFTATEAAAIDVAVSATGDAVFLLSSDEVFSFLPDANMRYFGDKTWLTRSPFGESGEDVVVISPDGEYGGAIPANTRNIFAFVRPAMWVDLSILTYDVGINTLKPDDR